MRFRQHITCSSLASQLLAFLFFAFHVQIFAKEKGSLDSPEIVPDATVTQRAADGKTKKYEFNFYLERGENGSHTGIMGSSWVNGKKNYDFENFFIDNNIETFRKLSPIERQKALELMIAYRGVPQNADPTLSQKMAIRQQGIISTELRALSRDQQVKILIEALGPSFWEEEAATHLIVKELLQEKSGVQLAGELLCEHSAQYIQNSALQYDEAEDAELAGKKLKQLFRLNPQLKATTCSVKGTKVDLGQIALSAEVEGRSVEIDRIQKSNLAISEVEKAQLRTLRGSLKCNSESLAEVFQGSLNHLLSAGQGVQSFIVAGMQGCALEGRLEKGPNDQYSFKFGFSDNFRGRKVNLIDLSKEWQMNIKFPVPKISPAKKPKQIKGSAGP